jgi:hypothetical protein
VWGRDIDGDAKDVAGVCVDDVVHFVVGVGVDVIGGCLVRGLPGKRTPSTRRTNISMVARAHDAAGRVEVQVDRVSLARPSSSGGFVGALHLPWRPLLRLLEARIARAHGGGLHGRGAGGVYVRSKSKKYSCAKLTFICTASKLRKGEGGANETRWSRE